jgi:hypothetical protein
MILVAGVPFADGVGFYTDATVTGGAEQIVQFQGRSLWVRIVNLDGTNGVTVKFSKNRTVVTEELAPAADDTESVMVTIPANGDITFDKLAVWGFVYEPISTSGIRAYWGY